MPPSRRITVSFCRQLGHASFRVYFDKGRLPPQRCSHLLFADDELAAGRVYLYMKTIERAHTPNKLWQRIRLKKNYAQVIITFK
jgi:hypothetical protein